MSKCEWCNKEFDDKNGKYRFCSHSCRSKYNASKVKNRKTPFVKGCSYVKAKEGGWKCPYCEEVFRTRREKQEHVKQTHPKMIRCGLE